MRTRGFSFIEIIIVIAVTSLIMTFLINTWTQSRAEEVMSSNVNRVTRALETAHSKTLASEGDSEYGVKFMEDAAVVFAGSSYVSSGTTTPFSFARRIRLRDISLSNGTTSLVFDRVSGLSSATGTVSVVYSEGSPNAATTTIVIHGSGQTSIR